MSSNLEIDPIDEISKEEKENQGYLNGIKVVHDWIKSGDCLILHSDEKDQIIFHNKCDSKDITTKNTRFITVDTPPELLQEGEWPEFLEGGGCQRCKCEFKGKIGETGFNPKYYHKIVLGTKK